MHQIYYIHHPTGTVVIWEQPSILGTPSTCTPDGVVSNIPPFHPQILPRVSESRAPFGCILAALLDNR